MVTIAELAESMTLTFAEIHPAQLAAEALNTLTERFEVGEIDEEQYKQAYANIAEEVGISQVSIKCQLALFELQQLYNNTCRGLSNAAPERTCLSLARSGQFQGWLIQTDHPR